MCLQEQIENTFVCMRACVRACVRACMCACASLREYVGVRMFLRT